MENWENFNPPCPLFLTLLATADSYFGANNLREHSNFRSRVFRFQTANQKKSK